MNILVLGSGGREHALSWKIAQSNKVKKLFIAPGNAGTGKVGENVDISLSDFNSIKAFSIENNIQMIIVGPEAPLVEGIYDFFINDPEVSHIGIIGPDHKGAKLEGSKDFSKSFMIKHNIPTASYKSFNHDNIDEAYMFLESLQKPYVLKADGLAAGKGVLILDDLDEAKSALSEMLSGKFGEASKTVVIEEFLDGIECSVFILTDGKSYKILPEAKDYKRIGERDTGLNTGGMGAISPVPFADKIFMEKVERTIIQPTINGLIEEGIQYKGFIFFGLMNVNGNPYVIEYNARMGDPEAEVVIPRIKSDIVELFEGIMNETLSEKQIIFDERSATTVMVVSGGYPEKYEKEKIITGIDNTKDSILFHAGTKAVDGQILTNGGRVIAVTSYGDNFQIALRVSYDNVAKINFENMYYRKDIGFDLN